MEIWSTHVSKLFFMIHLPKELKHWEDVSHSMILGASDSHETLFQLRNGHNSEHRFMGGRDGGREKKSERKKKKKGFSV